MFEYDPDKSAANFAKHGMDFEQAQMLRHDERRVDATTYSAGEGRALIIGSIQGRIWTLAYVMRAEAIRIISVRRARNKKIKAYEREAD